MNVICSGHLAGILIGLLYVKGPLKLLMDQLHTPSKAVASVMISKKYNNIYSFLEEVVLVRCSLHMNMRVSVFSIMCMPHSRMYD